MKRTPFSYTQQREGLYICRRRRNRAVENAGFDCCLLHYVILNMACFKRVKTNRDHLPPPPPSLTDASLFTFTHSIPSLLPSVVDSHTVLHLSRTGAGWPVCLASHAGTIRGRGRRRGRIVDGKVPLQLEHGYVGGTIWGRREWFIRYE